MAQNHDPAPTPRRTRRSLPVAVLALAVLTLGPSGCEEGPTELESLRSEMQTVPFLYKKRWKDIERCSGLEGDLDRVRWFSTPFFPGEPDILGQRNSRHEITIRTDHLFDLGVVGHEILHELLDGDRHHRNAAWEICNLPIGVG